MKKLILSLTVTCLLFSFQTNAQNQNKGQTHVGLGIGLPYGGLGGRIATNPSENIGLFFGLGYQVAGVGYNAGLMYYLPTSTRTQAYFAGMFGTNAAIKVEGFEEMDETYLGASLGFGIKLHSRANPGSYWDFGLILPFRNSSYNDDLDVVKALPGIEVQEPWPVLINVGYNFKIN